MFDYAIFNSHGIFTGEVRAYPVGLGQDQIKKDKNGRAMAILVEDVRTTLPAGHQFVNPQIQITGDRVIRTWQTAPIPAPEKTAEQPLEERLVAIEARLDALESA